MSNNTIYKRILIVKLSSIGDVIMTTPVAKALRAAYPNAYIAWVVEHKSKDVLAGNPYLDEIIIWKRGMDPGNGARKAVSFVSTLMELRRELRARKFDVAIDFQGLLRSGLVTRLSGASRRLGYENARECADLMYNTHLPSHQRKVRGSQQYLNLLKLLDITSNDLATLMPIGEDDRAFARELLASSCQKRSGVAALCPATTWPQKHWTESGWAELADALASEHGLLPVFLGSGADTPMIGRIRGLMRHDAADTSGKTTLKQAAAIVEQSRLAVAVDTGLLHIAMALDIPTIGLFGPTRWQHFLKKDNFSVVSKDCANMPCLRHPVCKEYDCMKAISAADILKAAQPWLTKHPEVSVLRDGASEEP
jgi:heptosyltransferase I